MVNPLTRLKSTLSTVTSTLQAVRELPGAMKEVVEFVRRNGDNVEVNIAYQLVKNLAAALEIDMALDDERNKLCKERDEAIEEKQKWKYLYLSGLEKLDVERFVNNEQWEWAKTRINGQDVYIKEVEIVLSRVKKERDDLKNMAEAFKRVARERLSEFHELDDDCKKELTATFCIVEYDQTIESLSDNVIELSENLNEALAKLARYEAAEKWHQVTAGDGELPPRFPVLWRNNHPDFPKSGIHFCIQGGYGTYEWRFLSSGDVPC